MKRGQHSNLGVSPALDRDGAEENVLCALWQHWNEAQQYREICGVLMNRRKAFSHPARAAIAIALVLHDGDRKGARAWLETGYTLPTLRATLVMCEKFPMHPSGAVRSAAMLLDALKGGAA